MLSVSGGANDTTRPPSTVPVAPSNSSSLASQSPSSFRWAVMAYNMSALTNGTSHVKDLVHVLVGSVAATAAHFRVLVFPLKAADDLPITKWTGPDQLELSTGAATDMVRFSRNSDAAPFTRIAVVDQAGGRELGTRGPAAWRSP